MPKSKPTSPTRRTAIIYARLSKRTAQDISTQRQIDLCCKVAKEHRWEPIIYEEPEGNRSGRTEKNRPQWKAALEQLRTDPQVVALICNDIARVSRSIINSFKLIDELRQRDIALVSLKEQFDTTTAGGRAMLGVICVLNQWFAEDISERQKSANAALRAAGAWLGKPPQGTRIDGKGAARRLAPSKDTYTLDGKRRTYLDTVRAWLNLMTDTQPIGVYRGALHLNDDGYRWQGNDKKPRKIIAGDLRKINETLSNWDGILDPSLIERARTRVSERTQRKANGRMTQHPPPLLLGVLYCAKCNRRYSVLHAKTGTGYRHDRGDCDTAFYIPAGEIDKQALTILRRLIVIPTKIKREIAEQAARGLDVEKSNRRAVLETRLRRLEESFIDDILSRAVYLKKRKQLLDELATLPRVEPVKPLSAEAYLHWLDNLAGLIERAAKLDPWVANRAMRDAFVSLHVRHRKVTRYELSPALAAWQTAQSAR